MGVCVEKNLTGEEHARQEEARSEDFKHRMPELKGQSGRRQEEISLEMISNLRGYSQILHARMERAQERHQISQGRIGYSEDMRVSKEEDAAGDQDIGENEKSQKGEIRT